MFCSRFLFLDVFVNQTGNAAASEASRRFVFRFPFGITHEPAVKWLFGPDIVVVVKSQFSALAALKILCHESLPATGGAYRRQRIVLPFAGKNTCQLRQGQSVRDSNPSRVVEKPSSIIVSVCHSGSARLEVEECAVTWTRKAICLATSRWRIGFHRVLRCVESRPRPMRSLSR